MADYKEVNFMISYEIIATFCKKNYMMWLEFHTIFRYIDKLIV